MADDESNTEEYEESEEDEGYESITGTSEHEHTSPGTIGLRQHLQQALQMISISFSNTGQSTRDGDNMRLRFFILTCMHFSLA